jgi:hypothetical protein
MSTATTGPGVQISVRAHKPLIDRVDEWRSQQRPIPTRPEAIRRLAEMTLDRLEHWGPMRRTEIGRADAL